MDVLDLHDPEAGVWLAECQARAHNGKRPASPDGSGPIGKRVLRSDSPPVGRMHLLVGCSIAKASKMDAVGDDMVVIRARSGETWTRLHHTLPEHIAEWRRAASAFGLPLGSVIFWLSGNDGYERWTGQNVFTTMPTNEVEDLERAIAETINAARASASSVLVVGPLPRIAYDITLPWELTASYKLDRKTKIVTTEDEFVSVGKALTKKMGRKSRHLITEECRRWFDVDGIHLSPEGYKKVAEVQKFPPWLVLRAGAVA